MRLLQLCLWIPFSATACFAQEVIKPVVGKSFGAPCVVKAEFIPKENTYYGQNMIAAPYMLKVIAVDGRPLNPPVSIEYRFEAKAAEAKKAERRGVVVELEAYETIYQPSTARVWVKDPETGFVMQGTGFVLRHALHIRPLNQETAPAPVQK